MNAFLLLANDALLGAFALAGISVVLLTLLVLAAASHPVLAIIVILVAAGALTRR